VIDGAVAVSISTVDQMNHGVFEMDAVDFPRIPNDDDDDDVVGYCQSVMANKTINIRTIRILEILTIFYC
jgi:hypothetical protein